MKPICFIVAIIIIIILAGGCVFLNMKMLQYKKVIDYYFPVSKELASINGKIVKIEDKVVSVETQVQNPYILPEEWKTKIYKVTIGDNTKITKFNLETGKVTEIYFPSLKVNDQITANANENIKDKNEFTAKSIEVYLMPETE